MKTRHLARFVQSTGTFLLVVLLATGAVFTAQGQSRKELEKKKSQLRRDIEATNSQLKKTRKNKSNSINELAKINNKITKRKELIRTINTEITIVNTEMVKVSGSIDSLETRLTVLKRRYSETLVAAYKSRSGLSVLHFVLAADDMNQAFKRMKYMRELANHRIRQQHVIMATQDSLSGRQRDLRVMKSDKTQLLASKEKERKELDKERKQQVTILSDLSVREKQLRADLKKKQQQERQLAARIEEIIRREIASAQAAANSKSSQQKTASTTPVAVGKSTKSSSYVLATTPDAIKLSNDFEGNRGRLPWPVEQGAIVSSFGRHAHPVYHDVVVNNNGVDIATGKGAKARAVFDGKVIRVLSVVDKYAVLVQHGEYFTLYSNLESVSVRAGEKVTTRQVLGTITSGEDDGRGEVHLEIWRGSTKMDPKGWLASR